MSRDFTPRELWLADRAFSLRDMKLFDANSGQEIDLGINDRFPIFSFLFDGPIPPCNVSSLAERALERITACEDEDNAFIPKTQIETILFRWFNGQLDEGFYYNTENNRRLREFLWGALDFSHGKLSLKPDDELSYLDVPDHIPHLTLNFPDWGSVEPGSWSRHVIGDLEKKEYVGLYREEDGSYTLQGFSGDDVVFCKTVSLK